MDKIKEIIEKLLGKGNDSSSENSGFTLVELLIVIAVIGLLAAALLVAIDPIDKIKQGRDTKVINDVRSIYDGAIRMYTQQGDFPADSDIQAIVDAGELKNVPEKPNADYIDYGFATNAAGDIVAWGEVESKVNRAKAGDATTPSFFVITPVEACYVTNTPPLSPTFSCP